MAIGGFMLVAVLVFAVWLMVGASRNPCEARAAGAPTTRHGVPLSPLEDCEAAARAKLEVARLIEGKYARIHADFDESLKRELSVAAVGGAWQSATQGAGTYLARRVTSVCPMGPGKEARVEIFYSNTRVNVAFVFGPDRRITGFSIGRDFLTAPLPEEPVACRA